MLQVCYLDGSPMLMGVTLTVATLATFTLIAGCGGAGSQARDTGTPGDARPGEPTTTVRAFAIECIQGAQPTTECVLADKTIAAKLHYRLRRRRARTPPQSYDPATLELDKRRVEAFYRARGYFSAQARARTVRLSRDTVEITLLIEQGAPTHIQSIVVRGWPGAAGIKAHATLDEVSLTRKQIFVHRTYLLAKEHLVETLGAAGYIRAEVAGEVRVDRTTRRADISFDIAAGPRVRFGTTTVIGNRRIPDSAIKARLAWREGDVFTVEALRKTRQALFELGQFSTVSIDPAGTPATTTASAASRDAAEIMDITIRVREGKRRDLRLGGGLGIEGVASSLGFAVVQDSDTRLDLRGRAELTVQSFLDPLLTLRTMVQPGYVIVPGSVEERSIVFDARSDITRQDTIWPRLTLGAFAAFALQRFDSYATTGPSLGLGFERLMWNDTLQVSLGAQGQRLSIDPSGDIGLDQLRTGSPLSVAFLTQSMIVDRRDDRLSPRSGWYATQRLEEGFSFAAGQGLYVKSTTELRGYLPRGERLVLAGRIRAGFLATFNDRDSPLTQRFFSGGSTTHRGFAVRHLSPVVAVSTGDPDRDARGEREPVPIGGDGLLEANVDLRIRIKRWVSSSLGLVIFADAGDVTTRPGDLDPGYLHVAIGLGLRYYNTFLPVRFDLAVRANRLEACTDTSCPDPDPGPEQAAFFHFSVGEAF